MNNKKFIGGGFPGIRECIDELTNITKESREKRGFSVRKIIPISQILAKSKKPIETQSKQNFNNLTEDFNIVDNISSIKFEPVENFLHSQFNGSPNETIDINLINAPINKTISSNNLNITKSKTKTNRSKTKSKSSRSKSKTKTNRSKTKSSRSKSKRSKKLKN